MKLVTQILMLAATASLAALALSTRNPADDDAKRQAPPAEAEAEAETDAWFV